jgi:5-methyltetrahydropteroyltriglutamate--homocysteine methyltransferase
MGPECIVVNPDCGLRYLPTKIALAKLRAMNAGAALVRARVRGEKVPQLT